MKPDADYESISNVSLIFKDIISKSGNFNKSKIIERQIMENCLNLLDLIESNSSNVFISSIITIIQQIVLDIQERWVYIQLI